MTDLIERRFHRLGTQLSGLLSRPSDDDYATTTAIWGKAETTPLSDPKNCSRITAMSLSLMMTPRYGKWSSNTWKITMSRRNLRQTGQSSIAILRGRLLA